MNFSKLNDIICECIIVLFCRTVQLSEKTGIYCTCMSLQCNGYEYMSRFYINVLMFVAILKVDSKNCTLVSAKLMAILLLKC